MTLLRSCRIFCRVAIIVTFFWVIADNSADSDSCRLWAYMVYFLAAPETLPKRGTEKGYKTEIHQKFLRKVTPKTSKTRQRESKCRHDAA